MAAFHFVGIGGSGMSALAQLLVSRGHKVSGSDRNFDQKKNSSFFNLLSSRGIRLFPQNGSGICTASQRVIISSAIEETIPDIVKARGLGIPIQKRSELLAELFNKQYGIAVSGTSGKTTVTGLIGHIMVQAGKDPSVVNGGQMKNFLWKGLPNNIHCGKSDRMIIEADESDGSIIQYRPNISVITSISKDHKSIEELVKLFQTLVDQTDDLVIVNEDCPHIQSLKINPSHCISFSLQKKSLYRAIPLRLGPFAGIFECNGLRFHLPLPGIHNIYNALAAMAVSSYLGIDSQDIQGGIETFQGINRRFTLVGEVEGIKVIDDFAHNPEKITATLRASSVVKTRRFLIFQPQGFGPTRFLKDELINSFVSNMTSKDVLFIPEIYYAGGAAQRNISSNDLVQGIKTRGFDARYAKDKESVLDSLLPELEQGDMVLVMGARDDTLTVFCERIIYLLKKKYEKLG